MIALSVPSSLVVALAAVVVFVGPVAWLASRSTGARRRDEPAPVSSIARATMLPSERAALEAAEAKRAARRAKRIDQRDRAAAGAARGRDPQWWARPHWSPFRRWPDWPS